ncbi:hypothetical protein [Diplocloster modestus]|uniref:Uncharacterized protein n=1 Tax=Diplocloster modestus TaxID=2850322 RepID=A0ABS6KCR5_9FIRM|nr:hypothetical protein [Diplocloster modestus]MBU9728291.1 hypothetical protein [Diplocloster modestus]
MINKLFGVGVKTENKLSLSHNFSVSLDFCDPIRERDARDWLQRVIADAAHVEFEVDDN